MSKEEKGLSRFCKAYIYLKSIVGCEKDENPNMVNIIFTIILYSIFFFFVTIATTLIVVLISKYGDSDLSVFIKDYAGLIAVLGVLLASGLASSAAVKSIENTKNIENKRIENSILESCSHFRFGIVRFRNNLLFYENFFLDNKHDLITDSINNKLDDDTMLLYEELNYFITSEVSLLHKIELPIGKDHVTADKLIDTISDLQLDLGRIKAIVNHTIKQKSIESGSFDNFIGMFSSIRKATDYIEYPYDFCIPYD